MHACEAVTTSPRDLPFSSLLILSKPFLFFWQPRFSRAPDRWSASPQFAVLFA